MYITQNVNANFFDDWLFSLTAGSIVGLESVYFIDMGSTKIVLLYGICCGHLISECFVDV